MGIKKRIIIEDFILNRDWTMQDFERLDLTKFSKEENNLFFLIKLLRNEGREVNSQNVFHKAKELLDAALATKILMLYMFKSIEVDSFKCKTKKRK